MAKECEEEEEKIVKGKHTLEEGKEDFSKEEGARNQR